MSGFGNEFESESLFGMLPRGQNNPKKCARGLFAEQISGSAFTEPRHANHRTWMYRRHPSVLEQPYTKIASIDICTISDPNPMRWDPPVIDNSVKIDFVHGLQILAGAGEPLTGRNTGLAIYRYVFNTSMHQQAFSSADGEMLIIPQRGVLDVWTELGHMTVAPNEIAVIPRGMRFAVHVLSNTCQAHVGYVCEIFGSRFRLPELGPIGANGLANPRDFKTPIACTEDVDENYTIYNKYGHDLYQTIATRSPFNVVAWHGNYTPYKYDLAKFVVVNTVSFDHIDPSIFTVLTASTSQPGVALCDFVIFPPRWSVADHTFRPPYYHRNCMAEFMGVISGDYEAKANMKPGGCSLHNIMTPHGPDKQCFDVASNATDNPVRVADNTQSFMLESSMKLNVSHDAYETYDPSYYTCWNGL